MTVIWTSSPSRSLKLVPKMMFASGSAAARISSAASVTSKSERFEEPVTLNRMPWAPLMLTSRSGLAMAWRAASRARLSPVARPMPMSAEPASRMTVRTSAKSRLMSPGTVMMSLMPWTPWRSTSSTTRNASRMLVFFWTTSRSRSLGIVMSVSTLALSSSADFSAMSRRRAPSKPNGLVTTPMVSAPACLAISAMTGAAPEPVPPPMPAVMKTMSESASASAILSASSSAARWPIDESPPAPRPRVILSPMRILWGASLWRSAWASVLQAMNSTPIISARIIRLTALLPPPPTPMTRISAKFSESDRSGIALSSVARP